MWAVGSRALKSLNSFDVLFVIIMVGWIVSFPLLWIYARLFPRISDRVLFWTNQGFNLAPARVRSYFFCREFQRIGGDANVLSLWEDLAGYKGLADLKMSRGRRTILIFRAMLAAIHNRAGIVIAQVPLYDIVALAYLKILYPLGLTIWTDFDDWLFDTSMDGAGAGVNLRDIIPLHRASAKGCIVSSLLLQSEMRKHFRRVEIIPTFPDAALFHPGDNSRERNRNDTVVFSWTGTFLTEHNVEDVLFLAKVLDSLNDERVLFQVAGDGHYREQAKRGASELAEDLSVSFMGWIDPESMPDYLATIDVGLYCLISRTSYTASKSPTKLFEYMACAKPTVSTNYGEAARFVDHGETGFLASDFEDFAQCCSRLLDDPELRENMGRKARAKIEDEYNIRSGVRKLKEIVLS